MYKFWTNPMVIWCRNVARALGITRFIGKKFFSTGVYERPLTGAYLRRLVLPMLYGTSALMSGITLQSLRKR